MSHSRRHVAEALRQAINGIVLDPDVCPNHPDLLELKRILEQKVATLEVEVSSVGDAKRDLNNAA